ncbi:suppressor of loss of ypt1 [Hanseniaspora osmophila]
MPLFIYNEFTSRALYQDLKPNILFLVIIHGISHFIQTILAFQLIGLLSPVNYSIANIMKRICVILVALFWENQWSANQVLGIILTICGLYSYDKWGKTTK